MEALCRALLGPPEHPPTFCESIHQHLNMYALAAGAAGVGVLALAQPVEAKIVYTPAHRVIGPDSKYLLDLNHDGLTDFTIANSYNCPDTCVSIVVAKPASGTRGVEGPLSQGHAFWAYALKAGAIIGPKRPFSASRLEGAISGSLATPTRPSQARRLLQARPVGRTTPNQPHPSSCPLPNPLR
jgi:hypothetical protein